MRETHLAELITAVAGDVAPTGDSGDDRVLDAALEQVAAYGFQRTTMDDIARKAGMGRMTVYRRFGSKDELLRQLIWREARRMVATVLERAASADDVGDRVVEAFLATLDLARTHPLVARVAVVEPEALVELAKLDAPDLLGLARGYVAGEIRRAQSDGMAGDVDPDEAAEVLVRLALSFVLLPRSLVDLDDPGAARRFARTVLVPILTHRQEAHL